MWPGVFGKRGRRAGVIAVAVGEHDVVDAHATLRLDSAEVELHAAAPVSRGTQTSATAAAASSSTPLSANAMR
jgi:hypothetical protein